MENKQNGQLGGIMAGALAYVFWGVLPIYWKLVTNVPPMEILAYRILWSFIFMLFLIVCLRKASMVFEETKAILLQPKTLIAIIVAAFLVTGNWFLFIYTVNSGHVTEASLGYYINPLVNVLLATVILKERLSRGEIIAVISATIGVLILTWHLGSVPWAAIGMAVTFSLYGLIKKLVPVSVWTGLTLETMIITPFALIYVLFFATNGLMQYPSSTNIILIGAGVVTAIPLLLFATAAKKISYTMVGFLQYIGPTLMLAIGVLLFKESFDHIQLFAFAFIWLALIIFTISHVYSATKIKQLAAAAKEQS